MESKEIEWLHYLRKEELWDVMKIFPTPENIRILELGGGDGYQAKLISEKGYDVISLDINPRHPLEFPVKKIDGKNISFPSETFDLVFTSHTIAHIEDTEKTLQEIKRVLKKNGLAIHIVPTTWWSIITNFWHYVLMPKYLCCYFSNQKKLGFKDSSSKKNGGKNIFNNKSDSNSNKGLINYFFLHPLGTNPSFVHEFFYFSKFYWRKLFKDNGFRIVAIVNGPYSYSGHGLFKMKGLRIRKFFGQRGITASYGFVLRK